MAVTGVEQYNFLRDMLRSIFSLNLQHIQDLDADLPLIDDGLRAELGDWGQYQELLQVLRQCIPPENVIHYQDRYHIHYILFSGTAGQARYHSIGPFRILTLADEDFSLIQQSAGLSDHQAEILKEFHGKIAHVSLDQALSIAKNILLTASDSVDFSVKTIVQDHTIDKSANVLLHDPSGFTAPPLDNILKHENDMLHYASSGDYKSALKENMFLIDALTPDFYYDISYYRSILAWTNALFRKEGHDAGMPTFALAALHCEMQDSINECRSYYDYLKLRVALLATYYDFYQDHSVKQYSPLIREAINYIQSNLRNELDLPAMGDHLGFSTTYILHKFKKEVGISPMQFVNLHRMRAAKRMLLTTQLSVQEIAQRVGIEDLSYFSKQFKKAYGETPREYRKAHQ